ncbi:hypothetical protein RND81_10G167000 [Saponaria officinalis]|uniref:Uncharacterized protein n=1 Tax=Saponaria officinalis TaxID=3572 RepID=A0AAW1I2V3_SAPOF
MFVYMLNPTMGVEGNFLVFFYKYEEEASNVHVVGVLLSYCYGMMLMSIILANVIYGVLNTCIFNRRKVDSIKCGVGRLRPSPLYSAFHRPCVLFTRCQLLFVTALFSLHYTYVWRSLISQPHPLCYRNCVNHGYQNR